MEMSLRDGSGVSAAAWDEVHPSPVWCSSIQIEGLRGLETSLDLTSFVNQHPEKEQTLLALMGARA